MQKNVITIFVLFLSLIFLLPACGSEEEKSTVPIVRPVKTIVVGGFTSGTLSFPGRVDAGEKALMSFRVPGRIIELPIKEGEKVSKNQLLAKLDPQDYQIAVSEAEAQYKKTVADFKRYQTLYEKDAVPLADLDLKRSERDVSKAKLDEAKRNLRYTFLRAPFTGRIGKRYVENFMDIQAQQDILDLNNVENIEVIFDVPEDLIRRKDEFERIDAFAVFEGKTKKEYPLTVKEVSNRADPATQTFKVTLLMPQPKEFQLLPGMTAEVLVKTKGKKMDAAEQEFVVPSIAVLTDADGSTYVWVVQSDSMIVNKKNVVVGELTGSDKIVVKSGLENGSRIVTAGVNNLQEGIQVRLWKDQE